MLLKNNYQIPTILVTGGAGFIGSHLCEKLLKEGNYVICLDNFLTGSMENITHIKDNPNFEIIRHDIIQSYSINTNQIYNLACPASPIHYQINPLTTIKTCVIGSINMLDIAYQNKAKILQASTSEVYGNPLEHPQSESYKGNVNIIGIRACYDEGKRVAETLFFDYYRQYNTDIKVIRIFNTYGPNMHPYDGRVISNFIIQALTGKNITIYGDGLQTRSFCYVDDLIDAMIRVMNSNYGFTGPVNIGNPSEITIKELAEMIIKKTKTKSKIVFKPLPEDDPIQRKPDIRLAKKELNWEPLVSLQEGLDKTIKYFKNKYFKDK